MNITRFTFSIALLLSPLAVAHTPNCTHDADVITTEVATTKAADTTVTEEEEVNTDAEATKTVATEESVIAVTIENIINEAQKDFDLTEAEVAQLRARLEDVNADVATIVAAIRTENSAEAIALAETEAAEQTAKVTEVMI